HLVHGAGDFFNGGGSLHADFGGFIGGASDLIAAGGDLGSGIAGGANDFLEAVGHADEGVAEGIALGTRGDFHGEIAFGDGHGNAGHFLQVGDHVVKGGGQGADFVVAVNINVLVEVAGIADFLGDGNEVLQGFGDGSRGAHSHPKPETDCK